MGEDIKERIAALRRQCDYWDGLEKKFMRAMMDRSGDERDMATHAMWYAQTKKAELETVIHRIRWK
jgi:hypothetical protein